MDIRNPSISSFRKSMTALADRCAALRSGVAIPAISAPRAMALATSSPERIPPLAISGRSGAPFFAISSDCAVGIPHAEKEPAMLLPFSSGARCRSTSLQDVPPAPATSIAITPAFDSLSTASSEIPKPTSFTTTGTDSVRHTPSIFSNKPEKLVLPSGCSASCSGLRCRIRASASIISTAR